MYQSCSIPGVFTELSFTQSFNAQKFYVFSVEEFMPDDQLKSATLIADNRPMHIRLFILSRTKIYSVEISIQITNFVLNIR